MALNKPRLAWHRVIEMNIGFLGLQFSFGLQQANMSPIYRYLGANPDTLPWLNLAGPMTGLLVQPLIGAMSDRTLSRFGRRTPYFLIGAVFCSLALFAMPYSPALLVAAGLLWVLDAANNITMEPYRAYVSDRLDPSQREFGFLSQAAFTGLAQTAAFFSQPLLVAAGFDPDKVDAHHIPIIAHIAFTAGAILSIVTIGWSVFRVRELPLEESEIAAIKAQEQGLAAYLVEITAAIREMPATMRDMALMCLFQWAGMKCYWDYVADSLARSAFHTTDPHSSAYHAAALLNGKLGGAYNFIAFIAALIMTPLARRHGAKGLHIFALTAGGASILFVSHLSDPSLFWLPAIGLGVSWGSIMGNPYIMLANAVPPERTGVYMGIFNMFIVIPMLIVSFLLPWAYPTVLGGDSRNVILAAGISLLLAAAFTLRVRPARAS